MNTKYMFVLAAMSVMLIGATAFATDSAFATKYGKNQAIGQTNACGKGDMAMNILCSNTGSQVQGKKNAVALDNFQQSTDYSSKKDWDHNDAGGSGGSGTATQDNRGGTNNANSGSGTNNANSGSGTANQDNSGGTNSGQNDGNANDNVIS